VSEEEKRRDEILTVRAEHKRLSEIIVRGKDYHETMKVRGIDGKEYDIGIHPLNDEEFMAVCAAADIHLPQGATMTDVGPTMKLFSALAAAVTGDPKIASVLVPLETAKIGGKVLEISGLLGDPKPKSSPS
jgi:hypothetical protein